METTRNLKTGEITVKASGFTAVVCEAGVTILIDGSTVHEWKPGQTHADEPSPRSRPAVRKRGAR